MYKENYKEALEVAKKYELESKNHKINYDIFGSNNFNTDAK